MDAPVTAKKPERPLHMLLREFFDLRYKPRKLHGKSNNTIRIYNVCFNNFSETLGREPLVSDLTDDTVLRHMQRLLNVGRAKATANRERVCLVALWRHAAKLKLLDTWPDVPKEKEPIRAPQAWMREEIMRLLATTMMLDGEIPGTEIPQWLWWRSLIRLILDTGERIGAVREARWEWITGNAILVPAEFRKGGKRDKMFLLSLDTIELLKKLRDKSTTQQVFPWPYSNTYLWNRYRKILEKAGLPTGRKRGMHALRRTTASVAHAAGLDAQTLLDHSSARITQRYLDIRFTRQSQASEAVAAWLRNSPTTTEQRKQA